MEGRLFHDIASNIVTVKPDQLPLITSETSAEYVKKKNSLETKKPPLKKNKKNAEILKAGYTPQKRAFEITMVAIFILLQSTTLYFIFANFTTQKFGFFAVAIVFGALLADFLSGVVHWAADTWGSVSLPVIGPAFIRPFREHHVDPIAMTKHDVIETNGDNCMAVNLFLGPLVYYCLTGGQDWVTMNYNMVVFLGTLGLYTCLTNQIHKWSHMVGKIHPVVKMLQDYHIILPRAHHHIHHISPHETYFCITGGWLNYPLEKIQFFQGLEAIIEYTTGIPPRQDDTAWLKSD